MNKVFHNIHTASVCSHGEVRWLNIYNDQYGTAEVCINGLWADMCSYGSDTTTIAQTFCRQLTGEQSRKNDIIELHYIILMLHVQYLLVLLVDLSLEVQHFIASLVLARQESSHRIVLTALYRDTVYQAVLSGVV